MNKIKSFKSLSTALCLSSTVMVGHYAQGQSQYFTSSTVNGGTYSWDDANWSVSGGTSSGPFASDWTPGDFARFYGVGSGNAITVTVNASESMAGMYLDSGTATLNINDAGNGTGALDVTAGTAVTQNGYSWLPQGFLTGGGTVNINAAITGSGGVEEESGGGNLNLYGNNTFTGGFLATSSSTFIGFNNNNSFGNAASSQIGFDGTTFAIMNNTGSSSVNIANNVQTIGTTGVNFIGNSVTMSGNWYLGGGSSAINIRNNGVSGTKVTLSGVLSATSGNVTFSGANGGKILLSGHNTYTGKTVVGVSGDTIMTLQFGIANAIADSTGVILAGGTLDMGGFNQTVNGALAISAGSTISYEAGIASLTFANSASQTWSGALNLVDWTSADQIYFGTDDTGLTAAQLQDIEVNGTSENFILSADGLLEETPEPSTVSLGALAGFAGLVVCIRRRRQTA